MALVVKGSNQWPYLLHRKIYLQAKNPPKSILYGIPVEVKALSLLFQPVLMLQNPRVTSIPLEAFQLRPEASWQKKVLHSHWS